MRKKTNLLDRTETGVFQFVKTLQSPITDP
jgi:hypothetical protein